MKKLLLDLSGILELLWNRAPWAADASVIWDAHVRGQIQVFLLCAAG